MKKYKRRDTPPLSPIGGCPLYRARGSHVNPYVFFIRFDYFPEVQVPDTGAKQKDCRDREK